MWEIIKAGVKEHIDFIVVMGSVVFFCLVAITVAAILDILSKGGFCK